MDQDKLIRVFPRRTSHTPKDRRAFIGEPPLFRPPANEIHISVSFTWDIQEARRLEKSWGALYPGRVKVGGPALGDPTASQFVPGRYIKPGVTFTSRGCDRKCPWCLVPAREGKIREIQDFEDGWVIQDNNFLQTSKEHQTRVFDMLRRQRTPRSRGVEFSGGIDARLVTEFFSDQLKTVRVRQIFLAADTKLSISHLKKAVSILGWLKRSQLRAYTLIGFGNDTIPKATARLERVYNVGAVPYAQLYQPVGKRIEYSPEWRALSRVFSRSASTSGYMRSRNIISKIIETPMGRLWNR